MYLPITEMKMHASRYYCNYCIMDVLDEEERMKKAGRLKPSGGLLPKAEDFMQQQEKKYLESSQSHGHTTAFFDSKRVFGTCQRCSRQEEFLYEVNGRWVCQFCKSELDTHVDEKKPPHFGLFSFVINTIKKLFVIQRRDVKLKSRKNGKNDVKDLK